MLESIIKNYKENEIASVQRSINYAKQQVQKNEMTESAYAIYLQKVFQTTLESILGTKFNTAIPN